MGHYPIFCERIKLFPEIRMGRHGFKPVFPTFVAMEFPRPFFQKVGNANQGTLLKVMRLLGHKDRFLFLTALILTSEGLHPRLGASRYDGDRAFVPIMGKHGDCLMFVLRATGNRAFVGHPAFRGAGRVQRDVASVPNMFVFGHGGVAARKQAAGTKSSRDDVDEEVTSFHVWPSPHFASAFYTRVKMGNSYEVIQY